MATRPRNTLGGSG
ncbi:hypothetical protein RSAG8_03917, partial [Rhizoctonia solani AG-8 WAC10335]